MKVLSIRQPWAWAIMSASKQIENRRWNTHHRGPVLLHAAKGCTIDEYEEAEVWMVSAGVLAGILPPIRNLPWGGIVGRARLAGVITPHDAFKASAIAASLSRLDLRWWDHDQYGFVLADVEPLPFIPWKGSLGLRDAPPELLAKIGAAA